MSSTKHKLRLTGAFAALVTLALAVSCTGFFPGTTITSITIGPTGETITPGASLQFYASGVPSDGSPNQNVTSKCYWTSSNPAAATINQNTGLATAPAVIQNPPQTTTITAAYQALTPATATLSACPSVTSLAITASPTSYSVSAGATITFTAEADFTGTGTTNVIDEVAWTISNTAIVPSITDGSVTIPATPGGTTGTSTVSATLCNFASNVITITATP